MSVFTTTPEQFVHAARIATQMNMAGLHDSFVADALELARTNRGAFELMALWEEADNEEDRDEAIADLEELIEDAEERNAGPAEKPYLRFDQLDDVGSRVLAHKKRLRALIDQHGGVSNVARLSGIPQPSLSRMLNSASMPRRTTLYKIANALGVPETEIAGDFVW